MASRVVLTVALIAAAWFSGAIAQSDIFPYSKCDRSPAAYALQPSIRQAGDRTFCFKIAVYTGAACKGDAKCCKADFRKLELDVNGECNVRGLKLSATVNGVPTKTLPSFDDSPVAGCGLLRIPNLGLNTTTADNAEICITLDENSNGEGCTTIEDLCRPSSASGAPGICTAAVYDTSLRCCPVSDTEGGSPPPPLEPFYPNEFPFCNCTKDYGVPLGVKSEVTDGGAGRRKGSSLHCFTLESRPVIDAGSCSTILNKAEIWADEALRSKVSGIKLITADGEESWRGASWGPVGTNTLKATNLNWDAGEAVGAKICVEVANDTPMAALCKTVSGVAGTCTVSLLDRTRQCCPTNSAMAPLKVGWD